MILSLHTLKFFWFAWISLPIFQLFCGKQPCVFGGCGLLVFLFLCLYFLTVLVILLSIYISTISIPDLYGGVTEAKFCLLMSSDMFVICLWNACVCTALLFQVTYQTELFLDKNKDYVVAEHQALLGSSKCSFVASLFPRSGDENSKSSYRFSSIGNRFKVCSSES